MAPGKSVIDRLLESTEPSIRWKTRVHVLGESETSSPVRALQREVRDSPRVQALLSGRDSAGRLVHGRNVYDKWRGAHWVLATLADIGYPPGDRSLLPVRDQLMEYWLYRPRFYDEFEVATKAASYGRAGVPVLQGRHRRCASQQANALFSVLTLGLADRRCEDLVERLLHWQWPDGGWNCDRNPSAQCSSFMESILPLRALSLAARKIGAAGAAAAARRAAEPFLDRKLFRRRSDGAVMRAEFVVLHYPLYWHYDVLGGLKGMAEAGFIGDPRCAEALDLLEAKRLPDGGFPAEARYYTVPPKSRAGVEWVDWGGTSKRRENEWVTVDALAVLRAAGRSASETASRRSTSISTTAAPAQATGGMNQVEEQPRQQFMSP